MSSAAVAVQSIQRRMRGGSQALLVRGADNCFYVAKCAGNPQGTRTLVNEWIVTHLLKLLQVRTPDVRLLRFERDLPGENLLEFHVGKRRIPVRAGLHLGSRCPVDPERTAVFDFLPRRLFSRIVNLKDFTRAFVFDKWTNQTDIRQAIFVRERSAGQGVKFGAYLIDHGLSFGGSHWEFSDAPTHGLYHDLSIYDESDLEMDCNAAVAQIRGLPEEAVSAAFQTIPSEWLETGDKERLRYVLESLVKRRAKLDEIINRALKQLCEATKVLPKAGLFLLLLVVSAAVSPLRYTSAPAVINLSAYRNIDYFQAPEGRPLKLALEASGISDDSLTIEVVNAYGQRIWMGRGVLDNGRIEATVAPIYAKGEYFFRVYGRAEGGTQFELLREYAVVAE